jgi:hypothetical protein
MKKADQEKIREAMRLLRAIPSASVRRPAASTGARAGGRGGRRRTEWLSTAVLAVERARGSRRCRVDREGLALRLLPGQ